MDTNEVEYSFVDTESNERVSVYICEGSSTEYGLYVWPCAHIMSQYIWKKRHNLREKKILEVGAGCGLPGALASKLGAKVIFSDAEHLQQALESSRCTSEINSLVDVEVIPITWGQVTTQLAALSSLDIIIGSDAFYDTKDFEDIIFTISYILSKNPCCEFWTTYQQRSANRSIEALLRKWKLSAEFVHIDDIRNKVSISLRSDNNSVALDKDSTLTGLDSVQLIIIRSSH